MRGFSHFRLSLLLSSVKVIIAVPVSDPQTQALALANVTYGPIPGQSSSYSTYYGKAAPFPCNITAPILNTTSGEAGHDDTLFQNLLSAEWVIFSFYQQGVEIFNTSAFVSAGFLNTTYQRIQEIRDNEAGHLRIFQDQISSKSIKPGACEYQFPFTDATSYLAVQTDIEISSMAFLTGLARQAQLDASKSALIAVAETESRHNTWSLIDLWGVDPFAGPTDTVYPYANQILETTNAFIVPGSCPTENPIYPSPRQNLVLLSAARGTTSVAPGANVTYNFTDPDHALNFTDDKEYFAVFFHGLYNVTMPFDTRTNSSTIPSVFEQLGVIIAVIADKEGAPTRESVVAGPGIIMEQPYEVGLALATS